MERFTLNKEDAILVIIDIQEKLAPAMDKRDRAINNTKVLITAANELQIPIIITEQYPKGLGRTITELADCVPDGSFFEKTTFTACIEEVEDYIEKLKRNKIILAGMETHVCVFQSARDFLKRNYSVFVSLDAVASRTVENYKNGLSLMKEMGAIICNTETILFDLLKSSKAPEFKTLSKLIK